MAEKARPTDGDRQRRRGLRGNQSPADWALSNPVAILALIAAVTAQGGAVRFGYTRKGDALAIGYLGDGDPYTDFLRPSDDLDEYLVRTTAAWNGEAPA